MVSEFSRLEFEGLPVSKRKIKPLIEDKSLTGWDDPRLPTLIALKRRGFLPEAIRKYVFVSWLDIIRIKTAIREPRSVQQKNYRRFLCKIIFCA